MTCKIKTINIDKQIGGFKPDFAGITDMRAKYVVPKKSESVESLYLCIVIIISYVNAYVGNIQNNS